MTNSAFLIRPPTEQREATAQNATRRAVTAASTPFAAHLPAEGKGEKGASPALLGLPLKPEGAAQPAGTLQLRNPVLAGRSPSDMVRAQAYSKAQADMSQTKAMEGLMQSMGSGDSPLDLARNLGTARNLRSLTDSYGSRLRGLSLGDYLHSRGPGKKSTAPQERTGPDATGLGQLSARFESGGDGIAAIGYDRNGGTSYGKYQVASRAGSLTDFLNFLDSEAPDISQRLRKSGPGNTGSRQGAMPDTWRAIAKEQPERFEDLQEAFIHQSHYKPALEAIVERTGLTEKNMSPAVREVIWSTAVQHGPTGAARLFDRADDISGKPTEPGYERKLISNVYALRAGQFGSSTSQVQASVQNRFRQEKVLALNLLEGKGNTALA